MAAIWQSVEIEWAGEVYTLTPTMAFINHLERVSGRSLNMLLVRGSGGDLPSGQACGILADAINWAAGQRVVTEDAIFSDAYSDGSIPELIKTATAIVVACMPAPKVTEADKKKPRASSGKRKQ